MNKNPVYVNRTLNLKKIQYLGFDMDHTLVRYNSSEFEGLAHQIVIQKLVKNKNYPQEILKFPFDYSRSIRGLVIDRRMGNILKVNRYSGIRQSFHGTTPIDFNRQKEIYKSIYIDLSDPNYATVDTTFSISYCLLFAQLVDLKTAALATGKPTTLPSFEGISRDIDECLDEAHRDGSLKDRVRENLEKFIVRDEKLVQGLERFKKHGKRLFVLTNSAFDYTKLLLDYTITPYLKHHKDWIELFEFVITSSQKPRFFWDKLEFLRIDPANGTMTTVGNKLKPGVYHGGCANVFSKSLNMSGEDILYIGDHIYGDILRLKKDCNWRTGLVVEELHDEIEKSRAVAALDREILQLMNEKEPFESELLELTTQARDQDIALNEPKSQELQKKISVIDQKISPLILQRQEAFNPYWGEIMRIGNEESLFASQVERFACIYMPQLKDLLNCSPRTYFRGFRRQQAHEAGS
ncbi:MAG: HAD-IG family 5'-nucleotidase [Bdellovibrionales bacterium]|nr:HAD-IG family 5'-nucleotidase [Bdellovibrionales bacterium]